MSQVAHSVRGRLRVRYPVGWLRPRRPTIEQRVSALSGVRRARASDVTGSLLIDYDPFTLAESALLERLDEMTRGLGAEPLRRDPATPPVKIDVQRAPLLTLLGATGVLGLTRLSLPAPVLAALVLASALPSVGRAARTVARDRRVNGDVLEASTLALLVLRGEFASSALLSWLRSAGDFVVARSVTTTRRSLREVAVPPRKVVARVRGGGAPTPVAAAALQPGDVVVVEGGDSIPVDGVIASGEALVNQQTMTGEALPVERAPGDRVFAVTTVAQGRIEVRAERTGLDTAVGRIVERVEAAADEKSDIQIVAERLAERDIARTVGLGALAAGVSRSVDAGISVLVADYGTVARVAIPTTTLAALRRAAGAGILIKGPRALHDLSRVNTVVFDKTGTLTTGAPRVERLFVYADDRTEAEVIALAAAAERPFQHPIARAITELARARGVTVADGEVAGGGRVGFGVEIQVNGEEVLVGSARFMAARHVSVRPAAADEGTAHQSGASPIFVAIDGRLAAMLALRDQLRDDASAAVQALRQREMRNVILLTGDHPVPSRRIAETLGLRHHYAEMLPEDKAELIRRLKLEDRVVAMVGDGVNDGLALSEADVGIAVPGGTDVATEAADIVLLEGGLNQVIRALDLGRVGVDAVRRTLRVAGAANLAVVGLASFGFAHPVASILISHGVTIAAAVAVAADERSVTVV